MNMKTSHRMSSRGATLIEVLVGCGVFVFLMLSSIAIMNIGTGGFRAVEAKADVTRQMNRFESDVSQELRRASLASVGVYTPTTDYHWALWMTTSMNDPSRVDSTGKPTVPLGDPLLQIIRNGKPIDQRYILYYVTRMDAALHQATYGYLCASYGNTNGPDTTCPHKWIVKKELYLLDAQTTGNDTIGDQGVPLTTTHLQALTSDATVTEAGLMNESESNTPNSVVHRVQVLAQNVLSFEVTRLAVDPLHPFAAPTVSASGPIVLFDIKAFKTLGADRVKIGAASVETVNTATVGGQTMVTVQSTTDSQGSTSIHTNSSIAPTFGSFTIQLDNRVIPQNP